MSTPKKRFQNYAARWADSFTSVRKGVESAIGDSIDSTERDERHEQLERQRRLLRYVRVKSANILRALADR